MNLKYSLVYLPAGDDGSKCRASKPDRCFLPHPIVYLTWVVCFVIIIGCSVIAIIFGIKYA